MSDHRGTSKEYGLMRLRRDAPELYARVEAGELSVHSAMVQAGFTQRRFTVIADANVDVIASTLRRNLPADKLAGVLEAIAQRAGGAR